MSSLEIDTGAPLLVAAGADDPAPKRALWRALIGSTEGRIGLGLGLVMLLVIAVGPALAPHSPTEIGLAPANQGPSGAHLFGTDNLGRDVLSRFLSGGRSVVLVPFAAVVLSSVVGGGLGLLGGYAQGRVDKLIVRLFDVLLALPPLLLVLVLIAGFGTTSTVLIVSVALIFAPRTGRIVRGATQAVVTNDYVAASKARGERTVATLVREVLPNIAAPALAEFVLRLTWAIIFVATLSFLGLGAQPPSSDWGLMVAQSRAFLTSEPLMVLAPAGAIALLSISLNFLADALTRHLDPTANRPGVPL